MVDDQRSAQMHGSFRRLHAFRSSEEPRGLWFWRQFEYTVYAERAYGTQVELLSGWFRGGEEALRAARDLWAKSSSTQVM